MRRGEREKERERESALVDGLLHPHHIGATPYRIILGDVRAPHLLLSWGKGTHKRGQSGERERERGREGQERATTVRMSWSLPLMYVTLSLYLVTNTHSVRVP